MLEGTLAARGCNYVLAIFEDPDEASILIQDPAARGDGFELIGCLVVVVHCDLMLLGDAVVHCIGLRRQFGMGEGVCFSIRVALLKDCRYCVPSFKEQSLN
ncbi:unnamed protein product [Lepeophtheirus salmonis]|uniref:(salmon louse) hypothetical protein n=1 Tax=Lepeophtheirus salmonis TaxID=72036 RepID=A0A7R8H2R2_LEPSM|nr:unnamed protein product [Lepeophtheirus salmonis]CAF2828481.1 unnamed protein product [Lepeophtheirus salmonis]